MIDMLERSTLTIAWVRSVATLVVCPEICIYFLVFLCNDELSLILTPFPSYLIMQLQLILKKKTWRRAMHR